MYELLGKPVLTCQPRSVVRILASGAGRPGSNPGGVPCGMVEE